MTVNELIEQTMERLNMEFAELREQLDSAIVDCGMMERDRLGAAPDKAIALKYAAYVSKAAVNMRQMRVNFSMLDDFDQRLAEIAEKRKDQPHATPFDELRNQQQKVISAARVVEKFYVECLDLFNRQETAIATFRNNGLTDRPRLKASFAKAETTKPVTQNPVLAKKFRL